ncbi:hypothetical protein BDV93DRAFT_556867 [Ceratobasidium sp. AG-I]|nr:hypothetical protein BDV93DRAFT_556867 [Ceratobasidium sp. AG-I]
MSQAEINASLARERPRRQNIPVPPRAQQEVDARLKKRADRNDSTARKATQAEIDARPQPLHDDDNFIFGPPVSQPLPSPSTEHPSESSHKHELAQFYLQKLATRDALDLRPAYENGDVGLQDLIEAVADREANIATRIDQPATTQNAGPAKGKGKSQAGGATRESQVGTNYTGITHGDRSHVVQSKYVDTAARRTHVAPGHAQNSGATTIGRAPPLTRTDTSTIHPDIDQTYPTTPSSTPRHPSNGQRTSANPSEPVRQPPTSRQRADTSAGRRIATVASGGTRPSTSNLADVREEAGPASGPAQPQHHPHQRDPQSRPHHTQPSNRKQTGANPNANNRNGVIRHSRNKSDLRYSPIAMGSRLPVSSKSKVTRPNKSRVTQPSPSPRPRRTHTTQNARFDDDEQRIEAVDHNVPNDFNPATPSTPPTSGKVAKKRPTIKGHKEETQSTVKAMLDAAVAQIIADGSYEYTPGDESAEEHSRENIVARAWARACVKTKSNYPVLPSHLKVLDSHVTLHRSRTKGVLIPLVDKYLGFDSDTPENNIVLVKKWLTHGFHQTDPENNRGSFQSNFIRRACRAVAFSGENAMAARFPQVFYPFPKTYVAYVCTITHHTIHCYRDGPFMNEHLNLPVQLAVFRKYMELLNEFENEQANVYSRAIGTLNDYCRESIAAVVAPKAAPAGPTREWSPDIPEPYICQYQEPPSDDDMNAEDDAEDVNQLDVEHELPIAGPSNHRDAYYDHEDDVATDVEMAEEIDDDALSESDCDDEHDA